jgi:hypothetical protein
VPISHHPPKDYDKKQKTSSILIHAAIAYIGTKEVDFRGTTLIRYSLAAYNLSRSQTIETYDTITGAFRYSLLFKSFVQEYSSEATPKSGIMAKVPANPLLSVHKSPVSCSSSLLY